MGWFIHAIQTVCNRLVETFLNIYSIKRATSSTVHTAEHSNSRFDSLCESIRSVKKSAFRFTSCHAVFLVYLLYSLSQKIS